MKSITVTTHRSINYGAVLQAYGLQQFIKGKGIENQLLDVPKKKTLYYAPQKWFSKSGLIACYSNLLYTFKVLTMKRMITRFDDFVTNNMELTRVYKDENEVEEDLPTCDFFLNGSDQVFGIRSEADKFRMLCFDTRDIPKFSYAASLGEYDWDEDEKCIFCERIRDFSRVSVREKYAKEYLEEFIDKECNVNIDPVFLLDKKKWENILDDTKPKEKYILCYALVSNPMTQQVVDELRRKTGLKVVYIHTFPMKRVKADKYIYDNGPLEFLWWLRNAEYVVTTSFHGTAFSVIFHKKFYTLVKQYKSQRMTDLLDMLGLSDRVLRDVNDISIEDVNYENCDQVLESERQRSSAYFDEIISCVNERSKK